MRKCPLVGPPVALLNSVGDIEFQQARWGRHLTASGDMRVLLVEDTDDLRETYAQLLQFAGCEVQTAPCGYKALERLGSFAPELVLTDYMMPRMDGIELIRRLRQIPNLAPVPMVIVTANGADDVARDARAAGAADVVIKPMDIIGLVERCQRGEFSVA